MNFKWIFALLAFAKFYAVEPDAGGSDEPADTQPDAADVDTEPQEPASAEAAVLDAIGLGEDEGDKSTEQAADQTPDAEQKDAAEADAAKKQEQEAAAGKKPDLTDADLAPLDSKNKDTNERFRKVTEGYKHEKERAAGLEAAVQQYKQSFDSLRQLGFSDAAAAEDLVEFSSYRQVLAKGDDKAFAEILATQIRQFESMHGKKISIKASVLDSHPDLQEKVASLELEEDAAMEVARSRDINARAAREAESRRANAEQGQQNQLVINQAVQSVEQLQANWQKNDPDYAAILPHLQPQMQEIGANYPPNMWPQLLEMQYKSIKKALVEANANRGRDLPLRGNSHQSGRPAPSTPTEAVLQELGLDS